jgi:hypothetical protein
MLKREAVRHLHSILLILAVISALVSILAVPAGLRNIRRQIHAFGEIQDPALPLLSLACLALTFGLGIATSLVRSPLRRSPRPPQVPIERRRRGL